MQATSAVEQNLLTNLKKYFGYNEFRGYQQDIIRAIIDKKDVLAILPTGAGKSICYQLPALLMPGIAIIISPLISLMQDQVVSLSKNNIPAAFLNSSLHYTEIQGVLNNLSDYKMLYIAPERLFDPNFLQILEANTVSFFAIDEAHCISQWGHSFRPEYRQLSLLKEKFPSSSIIALTATATTDVEKDISTQLNMHEPFVIKASFDRPNLTIHLNRRENLEAQLMHFLNKYENESGIIYAATRKTVDELFLILQAKGYRVGKYHAGLSDAERACAQQEFIYGKCLLMVATVAFGMGIHKPDIRYVAHVDMPKSIEQYYQEIGRAGRDGLPSECLTLYSPQDLMIYQSFLKQITDETIRKTAKTKTDKMYSLCRSSGCRRRELLRYFGETLAATNCKSCDNCLSDAVDLQDESVTAQKILSCVFRLGERFGAKYVNDVLRGSKAKNILERGHDTLSTYGLMKEYSEDDLRYYIDELTQLGFLKRADGDYPILQFTPLSKGVLNGSVKVMMKRREVKLVVAAPKQATQHDIVLCEQLWHLRKKLAQELLVPVFVVFGDRSLMEMATVFPRTQAQFLTINGVGPSKWEAYGQQFLDAINAYMNTRPNKPKSPLGEATSLSIKQTMNLYYQGFTVAAIAAKRALAPNTVWDHLIEHASLNKEFDVTPLVSMPKQKMIKEMIEKFGAEKAKPIKLALPDEYTYEEIRLVLARVNFIGDSV